MKDSTITVENYRVYVTFVLHAFLCKRRACQCGVSAVGRRHLRMVDGRFMQISGDDCLGLRPEQFLSGQHDQLAHTPVAPRALSVVRTNAEVCAFRPKRFRSVQRSVSVQLGWQVPKSGSGLRRRPQRSRCSRARRRPMPDTGPCAPPRACTRPLSVKGAGWRSRAPPVAD